MSYEDLTTIGEIQAYLSGITFTSVTNPTAVQVGRWINEATSLIYGKLASSYSVSLDITDEDSLNILKPIANSYVLSQISFAKDKMRTGTASGSSRTVKEPDLSNFTSMLNAVANRDIILPNVASSANRKARSFAADNSIAFVSSKDEATW